MISQEMTERSVNRLGTLKYFPVRPSVVAEVGRMLSDMCASDTEAGNLVDAMIDNFEEWPGPAKLREFYGKEVLANRPRTQSACPKCIPGLTGRCYLLAVVQRPVSGKEEARYVPYSTYAEFVDQERELSAKYKSSPTHTVESSVGICSCSEGTRLRKLEKARKSS